VSFKIILNIRDISTKEFQLIWELKDDKSGTALTNETKEKSEWR
jgi:hypothetical protein